MLVNMLCVCVYMRGCVVVRTYRYIHTDIHDLSTHYTMYNSPSPGTAALTWIWVSGFKRACTGRATNAVADNARAKRDDTVRIIGVLGYMYFYIYIDARKIALLLACVRFALLVEGWLWWWSLVGGCTHDVACVCVCVCVLCVSVSFIIYCYNE